MITADKTVFAIAMLFFFALSSSAVVQTAGPISAKNSAQVKVPNWFSGSLEEALSKAKAENKLVIIDFYSGG